MDSMEHTIEVTYDRPMVRRALLRYMVKRLGWHTIALFVFLATSLAIPGIAGYWSGWSTSLAVALVAVVAIVTLACIARLRASEGFFQRSKSCAVTFVFSEEGVRTVSELGTSHLRWQAFDEILQFDEYWLLIYAQSGYMTIPTEKLSEELKGFIVRSVARQQ